jgi:hypothetical protein
LANKAALTIEATAPWDDWKQRTGKAKDEEIHAKEAFTYADVAGSRWSNCWNHCPKVPVIILLLGTSTKLGHSTTGTVFKGLMLNKFGFEETDGDLIVEFFEDSFEDIDGAVADLMRILKNIKAQVEGRECCTFICFTGRFFSMDAKYVPTPDDSFAFWECLISWLTNNDDDGCIRMLKPIILVPAASESVVHRCQALLRDETPLGSAIVIFNVSWDQHPGDWLEAWVWEGEMFTQRTNKLLSFVIWNFCRALLLNVHLLPKRIMRAWIGYSDPMNNQEALFNLGAWALTNRLDMSSLSEPGEQVAPAPAAGIIHPTKDEEEADKTDNEDSGAFYPYSPTMSAGQVEQTDFRDTMDYNVNTRCWVVTDSVSDFTCKATTNVLMEGVTPQLFACHNKRRCPRCAAQVNIKDGYEEPELYKANARYLMEELSK